MLARSVLYGFVLLALAACHRPSQPPHAPSDALETFALADGFTIQVFASEPLIADPVAMDVDEFGNVYVVEMPGYPLDVSGTGRVKLLQDTDGDGWPDASTVFADNLTLPTGVMRWKQGILVTDAPNVLYLEDTDGDGIADTREILLTGFALSNPQHNFNKPIYGLDNWIHLANNGPISWTTRFADPFGDRGSAVHYPAQPDGPRLPPNAGNRNVRFRPDTYELAMRSSDSQFGHTFDVWGHHFSIDNSHPQYHEVLAARYIDRNPLLPVQLATFDLPLHGSPAPIFPITENPDHQLLTDRGVTTSASGLTYYTGGLFPEPYDQVMFIGESVHNLVHATRVREHGATFTSERLFENAEFFASTDSWFRPVNFYVGPDGALYVIDYYRQIVEHPEWMDDAVAASGQLQNGTKRGRIYRIVPQETPDPAWTNALSFGTAELDEKVEALAHSNQWWRRTAQRLIVDQAAPEAIPLLQAVVRDSDVAEARLHAVWTLEGLGALDPAMIRLALIDESAGVRENGIQLAERHRTTDPTLDTALMELANDQSPKVRFQLLCTLGDIDTQAARRLRQQLLMRDLEDEWTQLAALSASDDQDFSLFQATLAELGGTPTEGRQHYIRRISGLLAASGQLSEARRAIRFVLANQDTAATWWRTASLEGLANGLRRVFVHQMETEEDALLTALFARSDAAERNAMLAVLRVIGLPDSPTSVTVLENATSIATDTDQDITLRADAVALLALADVEAHAERLRPLINPQEHADVQVAVVQALGRTNGLDIPEFLLSAWANLTPAVRNAALDILMRSPERMHLLLEAVEAGTVQPSAIGWNRTVRLMRDTEGDLREKARALLSEPAGAREQLVADYAPALTLRGDITAGQGHFERVCGQCHQVQQAYGTAFGPDLATVRHWSKEALLTKILIPQRSIADGYELWNVERQNGETLAGVIAAESPSALTFRRLGQSDITIPRTDIASLQGTNVSAMPTGLEAQLDHQEMADLIAFLQNNR